MKTRTSFHTFGPPYPYVNGFYLGVDKKSFPLPSVEFSLADLTKLDQLSVTIKHGLQSIDGKHSKDMTKASVSMLDNGSRCTTHMTVRLKTAIYLFSLAPPCPWMTR